MRHISYGSRIKEETFSYDWLNNLVANADDSNGFYDRSLGTQSFANAAKPHRLTSASNRSTGSTRQGELAVAYDDVGQVTAMVLQREGTCLRSGSSCWARFAYDWDEVGNLTRARRWDLAAGTERTTYAAAASVSGAHPTRTPDAEMNYQYDGGTRVVKASTRSTGTLYTVYPFSTLELRLVGLSGSGASQDYALNTDTTQIRLGAGAVSGRVLYNAVMPRTGTSQVHLFLEFGDHLGSASFTIDHATSEVVEYISYTAYGQSENDYRTSRWSNFREPYRFTGKEEDTEVGLNYHGARYYSPALKRWMSADPVTTHEAGSDINPYSYGDGNPTANVDPDGREILTVLAIIGISALVAGATSATVQYATTGHVDWGWKGVAGAALAGAVGGAVGMGIGALASPLGTLAAGAIGGAAGGAASGATGTALAGGSASDIGRSALVGGVSGAVGGGIGVAAGSASPNGWTAFGGTMVGTGAGTGAGIGFGWAAFGQDPTWQSAGIAFASAFAGTIASTALSKGYQAAAEADTAGQAATGRAAGQSAQRNSDATSRMMFELETSMLEVAIDSYNADNQLACGPAMQMCARLAQMAANSPAGQAAQRMAQRYGPVVANWAKAHGQQAAAVMSRFGDRILTSLRSAPSAEQALASAGYNADKLQHVFQDKHMLEPMVAKFGSQQNALLAIHRAAQPLVQQGYQGGSWVAIQVQGMAVSVKGAVVNGTFRIGTATMRPF